MTLWDPARFAHARFEKVADLVARFPADDWPSVAAINDMFAAELAQVGVRLVEQAKTKPQLAADGTIDPASLYEVRIVERGEIPTRPRNVHDLLNALVWAAFPHAKLALTRALATVQRERVAGLAKLPNARSHAHDRLAMIDEGAVLHVKSGTTTSSWIFGHAIFEHAYAGVFDVRVGVIDLEADVAERPAIDRALAAADFQRVMRTGAGIAID